MLQINLSHSRFLFPAPAYSFQRKFLFLTSGCYESTLFFNSFHHYKYTINFFLFALPLLFESKSHSVPETIRIQFLTFWNSSRNVHLAIIQNPWSRVIAFATSSTCYWDDFAICLLIDFPFYCFYDTKKTRNPILIAFHLFAQPASLQSSFTVRLAISVVSLPSD